MCRFSVTPPHVASSLFFFFFLHVKRYSDFPALILICVLADSVSGSPLNLTCRVSDPCLCSTLISACYLNKSLFHSHFPVHLGPSPNIPFTVRNRTNSPHWDPVLWIFLVTSTMMIFYFLSGYRTLNCPPSLPSCTCCFCLFMYPLGYSWAHFFTPCLSQASCPLLS